MDEAGSPRATKAILAHVVRLACEETATALRDAMDANDMTQRELAAALEVSEARISRILSGSENVTLATITEVAAMLGCHLYVRLEPVAVPA